MICWYFYEDFVRRVEAKEIQLMRWHNAQRKASLWALEITTQYISWCMGKQVCFQPLRVLREHQHQTTCTQGSGQDPCMKPTGQGCWLLNPHCIFWVSLGLWWGAEFWTGLSCPLGDSSYGMRFASILLIYPACILCCPFALFLWFVVTSWLQYDLLLG